MPLPTTKREIKTSFFDLTMLVYGASKIGKSTWCSKAEGALFLATEPGLNSLEVFENPVKKWEDLLVACADIAKGEHDFKTIIIDTIDNAYKMCSDYICRKNKIEYEGDLGYGKGFSLVNGEFQRVLNKLAFMPYGLILISHAMEKEFDTRTGKKIRTIPTLPDKARKYVTGLVDMILYCDIELTENGSKRVMRARPHTDYDAGDRTGLLPEMIDLNFNTFIKHFEQGEK